ncbi:MAG: hypothetical protein B7Z33_14020 [Sphingomonadales bacterium 12-68-11]|nr:MAG: hypothetical protein B7Z33_14020 [Sphingomonadales bacterium 12-68-11]OYX16819.1 MAG: hypothetical protein B7Z07_01915 [Sphingomonadales bacterium 32-67-7]
MNVQIPPQAFALGWQAWLLGYEVAQVMWMRSWVIALGGAAGEREARRMVEEKFAANAAYGMLLATGAGGTSATGAARKAMGHYGRRVRANRRRLAASKR